MLNVLLDIRIEYILVFLAIIALIANIVATMKRIKMDNFDLEIGISFVNALLAFVIATCIYLFDTSMSEAYAKELAQKFEKSSQEAKIFNQLYENDFKEHKSLGFFICDIKAYQGFVCTHYLNYISLKIENEVKKQVNKEKSSQGNLDEPTK